MLSTSEKALFDVYNTGNGDFNGQKFNLAKMDLLSQFTPKPQVHTGTDNTTEHLAVCFVQSRTHNAFIFLVFNRIFNTWRGKK